MADKVLKEKRIQFVHLMDEGTINGLLDELLEKRVLNQDEMEKVRDENVRVTNKARALIDLVTKKGHKACQIFINQICEEDSHLSTMLGLSSAPQTVQNSPAKPEFPVPEGSLKLCPPETAKSIWREKSTEIYPIMEKSTRTRLALIICNTEFDSLSRRAGADADIKSMKMLLQSLGYTVDVKENLTAQEMTKELEAFAARKEHKTSDSTFLVFMSHGIRAGICGKDYCGNDTEVLQIDTIFQTLNTSKCPSLKDKPKVIIIQACRGANQGVVWLQDSPRVLEDSSSQAPDFECDAIKRAHLEKDFIAFYSSTPDNVSWRHPIRGSLFIMKLTEHLQEYAWSCDLEDIFRKVRFSFDQPDCKAQTQMPTTERVTLTRRFYLFPGY